MNEFVLDKALEKIVEAVERIYWLGFLHGAIVASIVCLLLIVLAILAGNVRPR